MQKLGVGFIRSLVTIAILAAVVWFGATVPIGSRTTFQHFSRIWASDEAQEMVDEVKEASGPAVDRVRRGVKAGLEEAAKSDDAPLESAEPLDDADPREGDEPVGDVEEPAEKRAEKKSPSEKSDS